MNRLILATELVSARRDAIANLEKCIVCLAPSCSQLKLRSMRGEGNQGKGTIRG
jgi:hypothetical protein